MSDPYAKHVIDIEAYRRRGAARLADGLLETNPTLDCRLTVQCFGDLCLRLGGAAFPFVVPPKDREVFAYLVFMRGRAITRQALAAVAWPEDDPSDARSKLRRLLYRLNRALPIEARPVERPDGLSIASTAVACDLYDFDRALERGDVDLALTIHADDFLREFETPWIVAERRRATETLIRALAEASARMRADRRFDAAADYARAALRIDPWREDIVRNLASAKYESGDKSGALREIETFAARSRTELKTEPMPETLALLEAMRHDRPISATTNRGASRAASDPMATPFVGRVDALDRIVRSFDLAVAGTPTFVTVSGEPGIGKSRLSAHATLLFEGRGARILYGATAATERRPYEALFEIVRSAAPMIPSLDIAPVWLSVLATVVPDIASQLARGIDVTPLDSERDRTRVFEAFARFFEALAANRPLVLVVEDLHAAGAATLDLVESLERRLKRGRILVVVTARDGAALRRLHRRFDSRHVAIRLNGLARGDVARMCDAMLPAIASDAGSIYERTNGNPFFVGELIRQRLDGTRNLDPTGIPGAAADVVVERFRELGEHARFVGEIAAVVANVFDVELVRAICGWTGRDIEAALDELLVAGFVREAARTLHAYEFAHQIVREAIYDRSDAELRMRRHARIARALPRLYPDGGEGLYGDIARHYERARMWSEAGAAYLRAARHARATFANVDAVALVDRGLTCETALDVRFDLLVERERAMERLGNHEARANDLLVLEELARELDDPARSFDVLARRVDLSFAVGTRSEEARAIERLEASARSTEQRCDAALARGRYARLTDDVAGFAESAALALELANELDSTERIVAALAMSARVAFQRGDRAASSVLLDRARARAREDPAMSLRASELAMRLESEILDFDRLLAVARDVLALAREVGDRPGEIEAESCIALAHAGKRDFAEAERHYDRAANICAETSNDQSLARVETNRVLFAYRLGDLERALVHARLARELFEKLGHAPNVIVTMLNEALTHRYLGNASEAVSLAETSLELARRGDMAWLEANALTILGPSLRLGGDLDAAIDTLELGLAKWDVLGETIGQPECCAELAISYVAAGKIAEAVAIDARLESYTKELGRMEFPQLAYLARARVAAALGNGDRAAIHYAEAMRHVSERLDAIDDAEIAARFRSLPLNEEIAREKRRFDARRSTPRRTSAATR